MKKSRVSRFIAFGLVVMLMLSVCTVTAFAATRIWATGDTSGFGTTSKSTNGTLSQDCNYFEVRALCRDGGTDSGMLVVTGTAIILGKSQSFSKTIPITYNDVLTPYSIQIPKGTYTVYFTASASNKKHDVAVVFYDKK